jgi:hypothetical protein
MAVHEGVRRFRQSQGTTASGGLAISHDYLQFHTLVLRAESLLDIL